MKYVLVSLCLSLFSIAFSQDAPLWMRYPAISPDGTEIVFSYKGNLFKVSAEGGNAIQLTSHEAHDKEPIWSKDGKNIAFASDRYGNFDVFLMSSEGGAPKRLTFHSASDSPMDFTPDNQSVIYSSARMDDVNAVFFPSRVLHEVYQVSIEGGRERQLMSVPAELAQYSPDGEKILFHNRKGYEDTWRKHHTSSIARDILQYDTKTEKFSFVITNDEEDRNPVWADNSSFYYLSEKGGSFNIYKSNLDGSNTQQITQFENHPVRFLSKSNNGKLCFGYDGEIYTLTDGNTPSKLAIEIIADRDYNPYQIKEITSGVTEYAVSPNGKEIAFIVRGEVFVTSTDYTLTKRITDTPEQERNLHFGPEGKKLIYSGERNGSWNVYQASLADESEKYFFNATQIEEEGLLTGAKEEFQAQFSPDGKEIAYLEERTTLKVYNIASKKSRTVLEGKYNYSYSDGDQYFTWSPDSKWLLAQFVGFERWTDTDVGLINVSSNELINLTRSGYSDGVPKFGMDGEMVIYTSDKQGMRSHGSWGATADVYGIFLTEEAYNKFTMSKAEFELWKEMKEDEKPEKEEDDKKKRKKKGSDEPKKEEKTLKIDRIGLYDRVVRLTRSASNIADFLVDSKGTALYFMTNYGEGYNIYKTEFKEESTKPLVKLGGGPSALSFDEDESHIYFSARGGLMKADVNSGEPKSITFSSEMNLSESLERAYMFEHAWRQFKKKFYRVDMQGVDWDFYRTEYEKFLPHINNGYDFAELLSEMLGEANASHTGGRFGNSKAENPDNTAVLGVFYDQSYTGNGLKIAEIIDKSPIIDPESEIKAGHIIEAIDGNEITANTNYYKFLNRKSGDKVLLSLYDPASGKRWKETVKPISGGALNNLLYERWVKSREEEVDRLSKGKLGYVHVRGMNSPSFREVYDKALGKYNKKEGLIVDTRFNGGGWLHDDLATFLDGEPYMTFSPRGQENLGGEPIGKWQKESVVIMSESNYSDAHMFPYTYKALDIGKLVGMPVPGTGTAVWWEQMVDGQTVFGIPQVGMKGKDGKYLENQQLEPDVKVDNLYNDVLEGRDAQLEAAVKVLLGEG